MTNYQIRDTIIFEKNSEVIRFVDSLNNELISFRTNKFTKYILDLLIDGSKSINELTNSFNSYFVDYEASSKDILNIISILEEKKVVVRELSEHTSDMSEEEINFFDRQINFFGEFETRDISRFDYQEKLINSKVAILGLGGMGTNVLKTLALSGIKNFIIVDYDLVEHENLHRQIIYNKSDIGSTKIESATNYLKQINSDIKVKSFNKKISDSNDLVNIVSDADLVINCMDEPNVDFTGRIVAEVCIEKGIPHIVSGGYYYHLGFLGLTTIPYKTACIGCNQEIEKEITKTKGRFIKPKTSKGGTLPPIVGIVANLLAFEAIKIITGIKEPTLVNKIIEINLNDYTLNPIKYQKNDDCRICGKNNPNRGNNYGVS